MEAHPDRIPAADDVDAAWLTRVLRTAGIGVDAAVESFTATSIGTGQVGENVRYTLEWGGTGDDGDLPPSIVCKFPSLSPVSRTAAVQLGTYAREVGFYRDLAPQVDISMPHVHYIGWNPDTHDFVLVMDDVRDARQGDQLTGCSIDEARVVVHEAVKLHAPTQGATERWEQLDWLQAPGEERMSVMAMLLGATLPGFVARYGDVLGGDAVAITEAVVERSTTLAKRFEEWAIANYGWCLAHGDYRLDNMLFSEPEQGQFEVTVVDWQTASLGSGVADVAYFLGAGLLPADREQVETVLVAEYAASMRERGVALSDEAAWDGYVLGSASGLLMAVLASQVVEQTARGDAMFIAMAERHAAQIEHVGLLDRL